MRLFIMPDKSCRGKQIVFLSLFCFSLFCPGMPCFARVSGVIVICSEITDCGRLEQNPASCYYLLVVKLVVKGKGLLLRILNKFFCFFFYILPYIRRHLSKVIISSKRTIWRICIFWFYNSSQASWIIKIYCKSVHRPNC